MAQNWVLAAGLSALCAALGAGRAAAAGGEEGDGEESAGVAELHAGEGERLARLWCSSCHQFPEPRLLDRETWRRDVLPVMGARLGIGAFRGVGVRKDPGAPPGFYPERPLIALADWGRITDFYLERAHAKPADPSEGRAEVAADLDFFEVAQPRLTPGSMSVTAAVRIEPEAERLLVGDAAGERLLVFSPELEIVDAVPLGSAPVQVVPEGAGRYWVTTIGTLPPNHRSEGAVARVELGEAGSPARVDVLAGGLPRPVWSLPGDFDRDGAVDFLVGAFGYGAGELAYFGGKPGGGFARSAVAVEPGALAVAPGALWGEADSALVLFGQGRERVAWFRGLGGEPGAAESTVLEFPPVQGSSSMRPVDFDGDGDVDLLYTAGDNADYSPVFKPFHGVYLFENVGGSSGAGRGGPAPEFRQSYFFPMHGAYGAVAEDFDGDGDRDIAAIAYFGQHSAGDPASFVYLENSGGSPPAFQARTLPGISRAGRFIALDAGDLDGDDDIDIALANFAYGPPGAEPPPRSLVGGWLRSGRVTLLRNTVGD